MGLDGSIKVKGAKQGDFPGQNPLKSRAGTSIVTQFALLVDAPRDQHSGLALGKRQWHPLEVWLPHDATSINWFTAIATNETLQVTLNFFQPVTGGIAQGGAQGSGGEAKPYYTIELADAIASSVKLTLSDTRSSEADIKNRPVMLHAAMTFRQITQTWVDGGKTFVDNWTDPT